MTRVVEEVSTAYLIQDKPPNNPRGYKRSAAGLVPEDWVETVIGELNPFVTSGSRGWASYYSEVGDLFVRITNLNRGEINLDLQDSKFVLLPSDSTEGLRTGLNIGDLLISITADIGLIGYVDENLPFPAYINQHLALVRLNGRKVDSRFIAYFLTSSAIQALFRGMTDQGAKAGLGLDSVRSLPIVLPPYREQRSISEAIGDVDLLILHLEKLIVKKQAIKAATIQQLLTGRTRLPQFALRTDGSPKRYKSSELGDIPEDWEVKPLSEVCSLKSGQSITADSISDEGGYPCYGGNGLRGFADNPTHSGRYVLVGRQGALCGNVNYIEGDFFASEHALVATGKNSVDMKWLALVLERMNLNQYSESSAQPGLSAIKLKVLPVLVPPLGEQQAIALLIRKLVFELSSLSNRLAKTRQLKQGMMQQLLTGKIRLVKPSTVSAS